MWNPESKYLPTITPEALTAVGWVKKPPGKSIVVKVWPEANAVKNKQATQALRQYDP